MHYPYILCIWDVMPYKEFQLGQRDVSPGLNPQITEGKGLDTILCENRCFLRKWYFASATNFW